MTNKNIVVGVSLAVMIILGGLFFLKTQNSQPAPEIIDTTVEPLPSSEPELSTDFAQPAEGKIVTITKAGFEPKEVRIKVGETVIWVNNDSETHTVNSAPHPTHTTYPLLNTVDMLKAGEQKSLMFPDKGTYKYHDHLKPSLSGSVVVE